MARQTSIQCGCGAKLTTEATDRIDKFDALHGSIEHQDKVLAIKLLKAQADMTNNG